MKKHLSAGALIIGIFTGFVALYGMPAQAYMTQYQPVSYQYGGGNGYGSNAYNLYYQIDPTHFNDHNIRNEALYQVSPSQYYVPVGQGYQQATGPYGYGNNNSYRNYGYYGNQPSYNTYGGYGYGSGANYGSGYGPYLPSAPVYDSSYAPYSNYYRAYPQVPHYMTGDTNILGQQLCRWADYSSANMPCGWDPQQWVYDPWTGTYY